MMLTYLMYLMIMITSIIQKKGTVILYMNHMVHYTYYTGHHEDEVTTPTAAATVSSSRMTDNELDKAYHNLGMAAETGPAIFDFDEEKVKRRKMVIKEGNDYRCCYYGRGEVNRATRGIKEE